VDRTHAITSGVTGAGLSVVGGVSKRILPPNWRPGVRSDIAGDAASVQRQSLAAAMKDGVNLDAHEGPGLGHTLQRHVGKPFAYLQYRLNTETGAEKSSFTNRETAETAITATLRHHKRAVLALEAGTSPRLPPLRLTFATPLGKLLRRDGSAYLGRTCVIIVRRNATGTFLLTAWLER
jgi:hypothetical protein